MSERRFIIVGEITKPKFFNRPSPFGRKIGEIISRHADAALSERRDIIGVCRTCAFRPGSIPNGCESTQLDVIGCVMKNDDGNFMCHEHEGEPCHGYAALRLANPKFRNAMFKEYATLVFDAAERKGLTREDVEAAFEAQEHPPFGVSHPRK